ncbi:MAG TPA: methionine--tRNA ligase [Candidatus Altiarchaeales archaeon]|nr:methionine--tRNA ligase [Candidatus Altiarchaeales archaeon]
MPERILVTAALPYANGPIHVGHAIGCYIPADVYARYHRLKGDDVLYICGTDEHGTPITVSAEKEGVSPKDVVDKYHKMHLEAFKRIGVEFDNFSGTARPQHYTLSQEFFKKVEENGFIHRETVERPFCPNCNRFLPDRYVKGECPECGAKDERGDQCEKCGKQLEPHELVNPYCTICRNTPEMRATEHWFFELSKLGERIAEWVDSGKVSRNLPNNARNFAKGWVKEGLKDRAITRDMSWGVPVPADGAEGKVLYVWFDAPIGYISSTIEWAKEKGDEDCWKRYWMNGEECKIVHFIGKDNIPFHIVIWPAMLMAHGEYNLPWQIASNEFLNLEGRKMSTSRGWVIWLHDILKEFDADAVRYYLLSIAPESSDSDFKLDEFKERVNNELIATYGNFVNRTLTFISQKKGGIVPNPKEFDAADKKLVKFIETQPDIVGDAVDKFTLMSALSKMMNIAQEGNKYFQMKEPWAKENDTTLYLCANLLRTLAIVSEPFLPQSAEKIWGMLDLAGAVHEHSFDDAKKLEVEAGHQIGKVSALYQKLEDDKIKSFAEKYLHAKKEDAKSDVEMVSYEQFSKLDLRVGEIRSVENHPNADKLIILKIDLGEMGQRQVVAGIKQKYAGQDIVGRQVIVVSNLEPAKIRGIESRGMLLAAVDEQDAPTLLKPDSKIKNGSKVA